MAATAARPATGLAGPHPQPARPRPALPSPAGLRMRRAMACACGTRVQAGQRQPSCARAGARDSDCAVADAGSTATTPASSPTPSALPAALTAAVVLTATASLPALADTTAASASSFFAVSATPAAEPANALSLPTWAIHVSSVVEWLTAMGLFVKLGAVRGDPAMAGMAWGMLPLLVSCLGAFFFLFSFFWRGCGGGGGKKKHALLTSPLSVPPTPAHPQTLTPTLPPPHQTKKNKQGGALAACTFHFFYNDPTLYPMVAAQAGLTVLGNVTLAGAAWRLWAAARAEEEEKESKRRAGAVVVEEADG